MPLILSIDTATEYAGVCLSKNTEIIGRADSEEQKNHASFVQPAIQQVFKNSGFLLNEIDAIAVTQGPGSYTGLRVGLSSAKGLCYALNKPLIVINTLKVMAAAAISYQQSAISDQLYCPMIDARRMEVFTAVYNSNLQSVLKPVAMMLEENSFAGLLQQHVIIFSGSGTHKAENILKHPQAKFAVVKHSCLHLAALAYQAFQQQRFVDVAYSQPFYLKEFFSKTH